MIKVIQRGEAIVDPLIKAFLTEVSVAVCLGKGIEKEEPVCRGAVGEMVPPIVESIVARYLDADEICPLVKMCP